jgi:putative DNA primase/helicase
MSLDNLAELRTWAPIQPLPGIPSVPAFHETLLPEAIRPWIMDISERMQCPPDYPAVATIVTLAGVLGRQVSIRPKKHDDWTVVPNLWGAVVGRPGVLKTPAIQEPLRMMSRLESAAKEDYELRCNDYAAHEIVAKVAAKELDKAISKALKDGGTDQASRIAKEFLSEELKPPVRSRYSTSDTTVEKLGELLRDNPRGILLFRDELVGWLSTLEREGREGTRQFFLEAWNGDGRFCFDRVGRGTVEIESVAVSVLGGIQPGPLGDYLKAAARGGGSDDGLIQRMQIMVYPDVQNEWRNVDRLPDTSAKEKAWEVYQRLDLASEGFVGTPSGIIENSSLPFIRFDDAAQIHFDDWREILETRLRSDELSGEMESHLSKFRSLIPSLALIFHLTTGRSSGVGVESLERALAWSTYLEKHAARIYSIAGASDLSKAHELLKHIQRGAINRYFVARDVYLKGWRGLSDPDDTKAACRVLEEHGYIRGEKVKTGGRPTVQYDIHPEIRKDD